MIIITIIGALLHHCLHALYCFQPLKADFAALTPPEGLMAPFDKQYDFSLACDECYRYSGFKPKAFDINPRLPHKCARWVLLVRPKGEYNKNWNKIRPLPAVSTSISHVLCSIYILIVEEFDGLYEKDLSMLRRSASDERVSIRTIYFMV